MLVHQGCNIYCHHGRSIALFECRSGLLSDWENACFQLTASSLARKMLLFHQRDEISDLSTSFPFAYGQHHDLQ